MLTSSFACTSSPASAAITSFAFMFELVPDPVWKTSIGNWSSWSPWAIASPAAAIRSAFSASSKPRSAFARAAAALIRPSQRATGTGIVSPETGKFATAFRVSLPQSSRCDLGAHGAKVYPRPDATQAVRTTTALASLPAHHTIRYRGPSVCAEPEGGGESRT